MFSLRDLMVMWLISLSWAAFDRSSSHAISSVLQIQIHGRDGRCAVGIWNVQVLLVTIPPYRLFDMSVSSKHGGDDILKVLLKTPDIRNWNNTKL